MPCPIIHGKILPEIFDVITKTISDSGKQNWIVVVCCVSVSFQAA